MKCTRSLQNTLLESFGDNLIFKSFKKLSLVEQNTGSGLVDSLKPYFTPSQMFSQERFEASFEITHQKLWNVYKKAYVLEFPLNKIARLRSAAYYRTRNFTADYFSWSAQKPLQNCPFFTNITNLQTRIPDLNKNVDSTKIISSECSLK